MVLEVVDEHPPPPEYIREVGRLCAAWSFLELVTDRMLWGMLGIDERVGSLITAQKDLSARWSLVVNHAEGIVSDDEFATLRKINRELQWIKDDRNIVVHGQIFTRGGHYFAVVTRGPNAGKFHPVTAKVVKEIVFNICSISDAAKIIANAHGWLEEPPANPEVVTGWPKLIEEFPMPPGFRLKTAV